MPNNNPEFIGPDDEDRVESGQINATALELLNKSEHAAMVQTANLPNNRRKLDDFDKKLMSYSTHSQPVALSMFYSLPRAGKQIIGASVRFAEVVVPCWKNCAAATRMIGDSRETVTAQGVFIDYEANIRISVESSRRITDKSGNRYNADMIVTTGNAASSIAYRNAILRGVPRALWNPAYEEAKLTAVGQAQSLTQRVEKALEYLHKLGVTEWQIFNSVGVASAKDLELDHILTLKVLCEEIKRGEKTIEEVFGSQYDKEIDSLFVQLGKNATEQRFLRDQHMGRAKDLVDYLRSRLPSSGQKTEKAVAVEEKKETVAEQKREPAQESGDEPRRKRGRPSKVEVEARQQQESHQEPVHQSEVAQDQTQEPSGEDEPEPQSGSFSF